MLYDAITNAETGSFDDPWIRTTAKDTPGGSSAFGPAQITFKKAADYAGMHPDGRTTSVLSPESVQFVADVMAPMQQNMLKYGGSDMKEGWEDFDYGGSGEFDVEKHGDAYKQLADEMMAYDYATNNGDIDSFIESWRGVPENKDERYYKAVRDVLERAQSK